MNLWIHKADTVYTHPNPPKKAKTIAQLLPTHQPNPVNNWTWSQVIWSHAWSNVFDTPTIGPMGWVSALASKKVCTKVSKHSPGLHTVVSFSSSSSLVTKNATGRWRTTKSLVPSSLRCVFWPFNFAGLTIKLPSKNHQISQKNQSARNHSSESSLYIASISKISKTSPPLVGSLWPFTCIHLFICLAFLVVQSTLLHLFQQHLALTAETIFSTQGCFCKMM